MASLISKTPYQSPPTTLSATTIASRSLIIKPQTRVGIELWKKKALLLSVLVQKKTIKKASSELEMNYSSAKTLIFYHRKKIKKLEGSCKQCIFKPISVLDKPVKIMTSCDLISKQEVLGEFEPDRNQYNQQYK
jgi:hypothetical protein